MAGVAVHQADEHRPAQDRPQVHGHAAQVFLERALPEIVPGSLAVFQDPDARLLAAYRLDAIADASVGDFGLGTRATGLRLTRLDGADIGLPPDVTGLKKADFQTAGGFGARTSTAFVQSERLALAEVPITAPVARGETTLVLDRIVPGLRPGQAVWLAGENLDRPGVPSGELLFLASVSVSDDGARTVLGLQAPLGADYARDTIVLRGNVVLATHGERVADEVLGSGDATVENQRFTLKRTDVVHLSAPTASGARSTASIGVGGVPWREVPSLHDQDGAAQVYVLSVDDAGRTTATFGDGRNGARLPTGAENVVASYRAGTTAEGGVSRGALTLLRTRPLGVRSVTNPIASTGADGPDSTEEGRVNAPFAVRTLGRRNDDRRHR